MDESVTDEQIVATVLNGDADAFESLITRHKHQVFGAIARHVPVNEVEDVAQETFIRAYKSLASFRGTSQFKTWLNTIAVRTCHDFWRRQYRGGDAARQAEADHHQYDEVSSTGEGQDPQAELLHTALDQLSASDRMVMQLMYIEENSVAETAELLGISQTNVKVRAFRIRGKLKTLIEEMKDKP